MTEQEFKCAIAHFDKKITDYQIFVDRCIQDIEKKVKTYENCLFGITSQVEKKLDEIIEIQNSLLGGVES